MNAPDVIDLQDALTVRDRRLHAVAVFAQLLAPTLESANEEITVRRADIGLVLSVLSAPVLPADL